MNRKELIKQFRSYRQIKPNKDWVFSLKNEILSREVGEQKMSFVEVIRTLSRPAVMKPVFATALTAFFVAGLFNVAQGALPGDLLYPLKQVSEKGQTIFASDAEKTDLQLKFIDQRVQELTRVAAKPNVNSANISAAFQALNQNLSTASQQITAQKDNAVVAAKTQELIQKTQAALISLEGKDEQVDSALKDIVTREIKDLEIRSLTSEQTNLLNEAKTEVANGNYGNALEKIWKIGNTEPAPAVQLLDKNGNPIQGVMVQQVPTEGSTVEIK